MAYTRPTIVLSCDGVVLLIFDAETTMPFTRGERLELYNAMTGESLGWYSVEAMVRRVPFTEISAEPARVPHPGFEQTVYLMAVPHSQENTHES